MLEQKIQYLVTKDAIAFLINERFVMIGKDHSKYEKVKESLKNSSPYVLLNLAHEKDKLVVKDLLKI